MEQDNDSLSQVLINLQKGIVYRENNETLWQDLIQLAPRVKDYFTLTYLDLILDEAEGYAFLKSKADSEEQSYPRLISRRALTFEVSLLLVLLRKRLVEFDAESSDTRLILSQTEIVNLMQTYLGESTNQAKTVDKIESYINKVLELNFLQKLKSSQSEPYYEVKRILKAFIDVEWLQQFDQWLDASLKNSGE